MLHCTLQPREGHRLCRDRRGWLVTTILTRTLWVVIWPCLLLIHLIPHNSYRPATRRSRALSTIERPLTGMDGRRPRHEGHHVLHGVADLYDLCILIICINIRIRHIFVNLCETYCTTTRWCMRHIYVSMYYNCILILVIPNHVSLF
jgi:hypothetical protein